MQCLFRVLLHGIGPNPIAKRRQLQRLGFQLVRVGDSVTSRGTGADAGRFGQEYVRGEQTPSQLRDLVHRILAGHEVDEVET